jgi:outer membrane protein OmpA-like peptidoglycan-associated protein
MSVYPLSPSSKRPPRRAHVVAAAAALTLLGLPRSGRAQTFAERLVVRAELGAGTMLSGYQRDSLLYGLDVQGSGRLGFTLVGPLALQASFSSWWFPSESTDAGRPAGQQYSVTGGLRLEPMLGTAGRLFVDVNAGVGFTGARSRLAVDTGLGFEFALGRAVGLGPVLRYGRLFAASEAQDVQSDAQYWSGGLSLSVRLPRGAEPTPVDTDGDGVLDADDLCPDVPAGATPDPNRRGCPANDRDGDGVLDAADLCPDVPAGAHPDPARSGCPAADADGDGIFDAQDQCPTVPQGATPDPARPGCPDGDDDGDGVLNSADRCPQEAQGPDPDPARPGCPAPAVAVSFPPILFETDRDAVLPPSFVPLAAVSTLLRGRAEGWRLSVEGHTDNVGSEVHNAGLSERRARAVASWFTRHGVPAVRLEVHGYGFERPIVSNDSAEGRSANRRVEFRLLAPQITGGNR